MKSVKPGTKIIIRNVVTLIVGVGIGIYTGENLP